MFVTLLLVFFSFSSFSKDISFFVKQPKEIKIGESYQVNISINKQNITGISKFEIQLPEGFEIEVLEASGANFLLEKQVAKFIWIHLPNSEAIELSYLLKAKPSSEVKNTISSTFHFVEHEQKQACTFTSFVTVFGQKDIYSLKMIDQLIKEKGFDDLVFKVQVGAYTQALSPTELKDKYGSEKVQLDTTGDLYKYTVGPFQDYQSALEYREHCNIKGAFLVLYFVDVRLSLGDAYKMIKD